MAAKQPKNQKTTDDRDTAHQKRLTVLQKKKDHAWRLIDGRGRGLLGTAIRARSVAPSVVSAMFQEGRDVIDAAEKAYMEAQRNDDAAQVSRVDLTSL